MPLSRVLIFLGLLLVAAGLLTMFAGRLPFRIGRLPGDFVIRGRNSVFYFPLATCLLVSIVLTLVFWRLAKR